MPKIITEADIRKALRTVESGAKTEIRLTEPAPRGAGRLMCKVRPGLAEWYALRTVAGRRKLSKLGVFPAMTCAQARERFGDTSTAVLAVAPSKAPTFKELCDGYLASIAHKRTVHQPTRLLEIAQETIRPETPANEVTSEQIVAVLRPIFERDARVQADKMRMYLSRAFKWGQQAANDYRTELRRDFRLQGNPVDVVPRDNDAEGVGERWLDVAEFKSLLAWSTDPRSHSKGRTAVALLAMTGQRVREILMLGTQHWDSKKRLLSWSRLETKTGVPHVLPVCAQAAAILDRLKPNEHGLFFPNEEDAGRPAPDGTVLATLIRYTRHNGGERFTGRDLRRTWKTLAGFAGLTKAERDMLQNHTDGKDVSSVHYDRYSYLPEKRAAVARWEAWLLDQARAKPANGKADQVVHGQQAGHQ